MGSTSSTSGAACPCFPAATWKPALHTDSLHSTLSVHSTTLEILLPSPGRLLTIMPPDLRMRDAVKPVTPLGNGNNNLGQHVCARIPAQMTQTREP